jgi:murein DD-endopeptidase MepM/ murein hydrolase activator NlpD
MALLPPVPNARLTQAFGPSQLSIEPHMFASATKAAFLAEAGMTFHDHFHPALDLAAPEGTEILASEAGEVVFSGFDNSGGGNKVQVEIKPNVSYSSNHCSSLLVKTGAQVTRGQPIAKVGHTGLATGNHNHFWVGIDEIVSGVLRHNYHNPALFLPGGALADSDLIKPPGGPAGGPTAGKAVQLNGPHINIRSQPSLELSSIFATSKDDGIRRLDKVIAPLDVKMPFRGWVNCDGLIWAVVRLLDGKRFIWKNLIHFV